MKFAWLILSLLFLCSMLEQLPAQTVGLVRVEGPVAPAAADYLSRAIQHSQKNDFEVLIVQLDSELQRNRLSRNSVRRLDVGFQAVPDATDTFVRGAMRAAMHFVVPLQAVTDDTAVTMSASRGQGMNSAFKGIKDMVGTAHDHLHGLIILVAAYFKPG